jgi:hypothetical protein
VRGVAERQKNRYAGDVSNIAGKITVAESRNRRSKHRGRPALLLEGGGAKTIYLRRIDAVKHADILPDKKW